MVIWLTVTYSSSGVFGGGKMGLKQTKQEIQQLKGKLKATKKANDAQLLKLTLLMVILAIVAGILYGRIQLW